MLYYAGTRVGLEIANAEALFNYIFQPKEITKIACMQRSFLAKDDLPF